jgi:hypothetical protein
MIHSHEAILAASVVYAACLLKIAADSARGILFSNRQPEKYWENARLCLIGAGIVPVTLIAKLLGATVIAHPITLMIGLLALYVLPLIGIIPAVVLGSIVRKICNHWASQRISSAYGAKGLAASRTEDSTSPGQVLNPTLSLTPP